MKFAQANGQREVAKPDLSGSNPVCERPVVSKCGEIKVWHRAHKGKCECDPWQDNEAEWHRVWKGHFPYDWQERIHTDENVERHIADVKIIKDWVLEFQHSYIELTELQVRNAFYKKLVWVADGTRRKRDKQQLFESLREVAQVSNPQSPVRRDFKVLPNDSALIRDWSGGHAPIFVDFGSEDPVLWCLISKFSEGEIYVLEFWRAGFIAFHRNEVIESDYFADLMKNFRNTIWQLIEGPKSQPRPHFVPQRRFVAPRRHFRF
ncbi:MAG TPA: competence protein CoiA family protein [Pseudobdellovibrionaceae bacterium]|nr:competence protein CoiA family protein [Pseudobdellovibrionaceae bacterium]